MTESQKTVTYSVLDSTSIETTCRSTFVASKSGKQNFTVAFAVVVGVEGVTRALLRMGNEPFLRVFMTEVTSGQLMS